MDDEDQSALCLILKGNTKNCAKIIKILFDSGYIMQESDRLLFLEDHPGQKNGSRKYLKLIQKLQVEVDNEIETFSDLDVWQFSLARSDWTLMSMDLTFYSIKSMENYI